MGPVGLEDEAAGVSLGAEGSDPVPEVVATVGVDVLLEPVLWFDEHELTTTALRAIATNGVKIR
jgi:hypothetical protein